MLCSVCSLCDSDTFVRCNAEMLQCAGFEVRRFDWVEKECFVICQPETSASNLFEAFPSLPVTRVGALVLLCGDICFIERGVI